MWREITALWSLGALLFSPATRERIAAPPPVVEEVAPQLLPQVIRTAVSSDMKERFDECLQGMAQQIKQEFADEIVARHPVFRTPIRVSDSRVTIDKIVRKLQQKTQSYVDQGGGVRIDLEWNPQRHQWALSGYLLWWKDSKTGEVCRQYASSLKELQKLVCASAS